MAELNLKQIEDRLNAEFTGDTRKLVFWYDDRADFEQDIPNLKLESAKVLILEKDNQFQTKYFLERKDTTTSYLVYAPFPKPDVKDNHLEDTMLYSKRFFADRASLLSVDLKIDEKYKPLIEKYIAFFGEKKRTERFYALDIEEYNEETILTGMLAACCGVDICSFEQVLRVVLAEGELENNKFFAAMRPANLEPAFWLLCRRQFGLREDCQTLEKLVLSLFVTTVARQLPDRLPKAWEPFRMDKAGNSIAFLDSMMNSILYTERFGELSAYAAKALDAASVLAAVEPELLVGCESFLDVDRILVRWITRCLLNENTGAMLGSLTIPELCEKREKLHFGFAVGSIYPMLASAHKILCAADYLSAGTFDEIVADYCEQDYQLDRAYRNFYTAYDALENTSAFEPLQALVEKIYTGSYLDELLPCWNRAIQQHDAFKNIKLQRNFYSEFVGAAKERTVVIISDAMRYEVGRELYERMMDEARANVKLSVQLSTLPSYTRLGMAALLPHFSLTMTEDYQVLADGILCDNLAGRQTVLEKHRPNSVCLQFDDVKNMKKDELREIFTGKQLLYVYHNQIDARGDKPITEDETFTACKEAVQEIAEFIQRISVSANTYRFFVTADHGFLYKRDKLTESDKISGVVPKDAFVNRRFIVSDTFIDESGVHNMKLGRVLGNEDERIVSYPSSSNVFKVAGGGQNFVHGGSSPQEMLVPVLDVKMDKGHRETESVKIALVSILSKITNLITSMDFVQSDAVSDTVKPAAYRIFFVDENDCCISNEVIHIADSRDENTQKRIFRLRFTFKNQKYDRDKQYALVVQNNGTGVELFRHAVMMDLAFTEDFGF